MIGNVGAGVGDMIGVDPAAIVSLTRIDAVADARERFVAVAADWIEDHYGMAYFRWEDHWHYVPYEVLARAFSRDELLWLWHSCVLSSKIDDHLQEQEELTWKVQHALWRYGGSRDYARFVACHNGLGRLLIDLPGFALRVTHTRYINTAAWAVHGRNNPIYLDASFGVLLYYRGRHVMTIGFAPSRYGILVAQVQLREKRGNRFLYKLPVSYLDLALDLLQRAFPDEPLYLVTGSSTTAAIRSAYGKNAGRLSAEVAVRIERFYDQSLGSYVRTGGTVHGSGDDGRMFARLTRRRRGARILGYLVQGWSDRV